MGLNIDMNNSYVVEQNERITGLQNDALQYANQLGIDLTRGTGDDQVVLSNGTATQKNISASAAKQYTEEEIQAILSNYNEKMEALQKAVEEYNAVIIELKQKVLEEQEVYDKHDALYKDAEANYNIEVNNYEQNVDKYKEIEKKIEEATKESADDVKQKQQNAIYQAMADYDENEDGDYNSYLEDCLAGVVPDSSFASLISSLSSQATSINSKLGSIKTRMHTFKQEMDTQKTLMDVSKTKIDQLNSEIATKEGLKAQASNEISTMRTELANIALSSISEEEKQLAINNNIDLTETFPDGSPKYIIAMGKSDNKFHIYEMDGQGSNTATSLARKYAPNQGFDIVSSGNGYMRGISETDENSICTTVFNFTCINECLTEGTADCQNLDFCTCSPLSFDINGDGVKTSTQLVNFDIDGDGKVDTINDSADAVLVFDADGDGISGESGLECFGDNSDLDGDGIADGYANGFITLKTLARNANLINGIDDNTLDENDLRYLEENYGLQIKLGGYTDEASSLLDSGITEINLSMFDDTQMQKNFDGLYNDLMTQEGATFVVNGEEREYADIWHLKKEEFEFELE